MAATRRRRSRQVEPDGFASILLAVSRLPPDDTVRIAASWRVRILVSQAGGDTQQLAALLGTTTRGAQRIRQAYGLAALRGVAQGDRAK